MSTERPKTEREEALEEIIDDTERAHRALERAGKTAASVGDTEGSKELEEVAERVEQIGKKFGGIRDKKTG
jgi:DNA-binding ferritin-like protein